MKNFKQIFVRLFQEESGQDLIEYALVAALIALAAVGSMKTLAGDISTAFTTVGTNLNTAVAGS